MSNRRKTEFLPESATIFNAKPIDVLVAFNLKARGRAADLTLYFSGQKAGSKKVK